MSRDAIEECVASRANGGEDTQLCPLAYTIAGRLSETETKGDEERVAGGEPPPAPERVPEQHRVMLARTVPLVRDLMAWDWRGSEIAVVETRLKDALHGYGAVGGELTHEMLWFRGRPCDSRDGYSHLKDCIYPKVQRDFGRANYPNESVFYASRNETTVLAEKQVRAGECIQMIATRVRKRRTLKSIVIGEIERSYNLGRSLMGDDRIVDAVDRHIFQGVPEEDARGQVFCDAFMGDQFANGEIKTPNDYKLTAAYAHNPINTGGAVVYPSVALRGGTNVALAGAVFDELFEVLWTAVYEVEEYYGYGQWRLRMSRSCCDFASDGQIRWDSRKVVIGRETLRQGKQVPAGVEGWRVPEGGIVR